MNSRRLPNRILYAALLAAAFHAMILSPEAVAQAPAQNASAPPKQSPVPTTQSTSNTPTSTSQTQTPTSPAPSAYRAGLNVVVLDPAHGGTDQGARGTEGIRESEEVLQFATATKKALETQGFQVILTREGNENPSFDDRSARTNAQRGAVMISLHIASTGLAGTVRVYVEPDQPASSESTGLIPWDRAQVPFLSLSRKLGDLVQQEMTRRFKGSPSIVLTAPVRQLRTTAAPAIAVEISSVSVADRTILDQMVSGVADSITRGVVAFRPLYVVPTIQVPGGSVQP